MPDRQHAGILPSGRGSAPGPTNFPRNDLVTAFLTGIKGLNQPANGWNPSQSFRSSASEVLKIVTAFTIAHSITLAFATYGEIKVSSRWVEALIAASVVLAALNNLVPIFRGMRWPAAFAFGLVHGFGFASVLADLGLPTGRAAIALLGFNVGVELGQLVIVGVFLPAAFLLRQTLFYRQLMFAGSAFIALIACGWLLERSLGLTLLPA